MFLHGFEQCGLRLRGSTVDFVGKDNVAEDRTGLELEGRVTIFVFYDDVRTRNVRRHQVGRELNTGEGKVEYAAKRTNQTGLTYARYTFKQYVTTSDHCDDRTFNDIFLTDNVALDLGEDIFALFAEFFNVLFRNHNIFSSLKIFSFLIFVGCELHDNLEIGLNEFAQFIGNVFGGFEPLHSFFVVPARF